MTIELWAVDLWKKVISLAETNNSNAWAHLAQCLTNISTIYACIGNQDEARANSQKALDIIEWKLDCNGLSPEAQELFAINLCTQAISACAPAPMDSIEMATRAALTTEATLNLQEFQAKRLRIGTLASLSIDSYSIHRSAPEVNETNLKCGLLDSCFSHDSLYAYTRALINLSYTQQIRGYFNSTHATTKKRALIVLHSLFLKYPESQRLLACTASVVLEIANSVFINFNSLADILACSEEGVTRYRELWQTSFPTYVICLLDMLQCFRRTVISARTACKSESMLELSTLSDFGTESYQDVKWPSESDGDYQLHLATIFHYEDRSYEGIHAAYNAVKQYSALGSLDRDRSPFQLIRALTVLCEMLHEKNQYKLVVIEGFKAMELVDSGVETDTKIQNFVNSTEHISLIDCIVSALAASPDPDTVKKVSVLITRFSKVFHVLNSTLDFFPLSPSIYMELLAKTS